MSNVLLLTGTCGSGKTTIFRLLAERAGWVCICEDDIWVGKFGNDRGALDSDEHRAKRRQVNEVTFAACLAAVAADQPVVIDATIHEAPPEAFSEYREFFETHSISWTLRVLHPRADVAIARDASRAIWHIGSTGVLELRNKFNGGVFGSECFVDSSDDTPQQTLHRLLASFSVTSNP